MLHPSDARLKEGRYYFFMRARLSAFSRSFSFLRARSASATRFFSTCMARNAATRAA